MRSPTITTDNSFSPAGQLVYWPDLALLSISRCRVTIQGETLVSRTPSNSSQSVQSGVRHSHVVRTPLVTRDCVGS